jgi:hypothetical protein
VTHRPEDHLYVSGATVPRCGLTPDVATALRARPGIGLAPPALPDAELSEAPASARWPLRLAPVRPHRVVFRNAVTYRKVRGARVEVSRRQVGRLCVYCLRAAEEAALVDRAIRASGRATVTRDRAIPGLGRGPTVRVIQL